MTGYDEIFDAIKVMVLGMLVGRDDMSWCTVNSYDDATHTCQVTLRPGGLTFPAVPVLVPFRGVRMPHNGGMQGVVLLLNGEPQVLLGVTYTTKDVIPDRGLMLEESLLVIGDVTVAGGLYLGVSMELPPALPQYKYALTTVSERPMGTPNARPARTYVCLPSADGTLRWVAFAAAP